jgi:hypothetical protein
MEVLSTCTTSTESGALTVVRPYHFDTEERDIILDRDFGWSTIWTLFLITSFAKVSLKGRAGYIDGIVVIRISDHQPGS